MIPPFLSCENRESREIDTRRVRKLYPRASEILDAILRAVVFSALGVIPFDSEPGPSRAMNWTDELDCADVS